MSSPLTQSLQSEGCLTGTPRRPLIWTAMAVTLGLAAACDTPGVTLIDPDVAGRPDSVTFHVSLHDTLLARALGWQHGVTGAEVQLHRIVDPFQPHILYTDSTGNAYISNLFPGLYKIAGYRVLSGQETAPTGNIVRAFGDGFKQRISGGSNVSLTLATDREGSLVISEVYYGGLTHANDYYWARFYELYNNSDTTIYVDGMLLGYAFGTAYSAVLTCEENWAFREDPAGLWSIEFHQFPGSGTEYPVTPGQVVTVAVDAVDHSLADPTLPNLSQADFELEGSADPDNPDVPNMPSRGTYTNPLGHGMLAGPTHVMFLALRVDVASLVTQVHMQGHRHVRIPTERILDVAHGMTETPDSDPATYLPTYYCLSWVNRDFDRLESAVYRPGNDNRVSLHRRVLRTVAGRPILQDVNTSRLDFRIGLYSPGRIQY